MKYVISKYFNKNEEAFYINDFGEKRFRGVKRYYGDSVRNDKADEQAKISPVSISTVFSYVNEFLEMIRFNNGVTEKNIRCEHIELDNIHHMIVDNGIIVKGCIWSSSIWDTRQSKYTIYDKKYDIIQNKFNLMHPSDIIWLKFTTKGHLGVVAKSCDINYDYNLSSGILVEQVSEQWDDSFVIIFPLTNEVLKSYSTGDIELGVGNYLISKGIPIIDYYSHNN